MARASYIYKVVDNWETEVIEGQTVPVTRCFTVKWEAVEYVQKNCGDDDPNKRFKCTRYRDGQHVQPEQLTLIK